MATFLGLLSWAGFLGCTTYSAYPQDGLKGLWISACTLLSDVVWTLVTINGSVFAPHMDIIGYVMTGIVTFLMCIQVEQWLPSFVPGTSAGAYATPTGQEDWRLVTPSLALSLVLGYAMKNSGLWLTSCRENRISSTLTSK